MKYWILAAAVAMAACAASEPAAQSAAQQPAPPPSAAATDYSDARSTASDAEVRDARRAYRAACQQSQSDAYCECMTGGMAQALSPAELAVATAAFTNQSAAASQQTRDHVAAVRTEVDRGCAEFRRS